MEVFIKPDGNAHCIYGETLPLARLGKLHITRASHVEPTSDGNGRPISRPSAVPFLVRLISERSSAPKSLG